MENTTQNTTQNTVLSERTSLTQLMDQIGSRIDSLQRDYHELAARIDALTPGADDNRHYDDHIEIAEVRADRRRFWSNLKSQAVAGAVMAIGGGLVGWLVFALMAKVG